MVLSEIFLGVGWSDEEGGLGDEGSFIVVEGLIQTCDSVGWFGACKGSRTLLIELLNFFSIV